MGKLLIMSACVTLHGSTIQLVPLAEDHVAGLLAAATQGRDTFQFTGVPADPPTMRAYVEYALRDHEAGNSVPFAVVKNSDQRVVGTTRFFDIERWEANEARGAVSVAEIGFTWLAPDAQGTGANTEAKLLLLDHGFGELGLVRVCFRTDARNLRSRAALEKLGARFEGIRRAHMPAFDGGVRDSAFYSILKDEWPALREQLDSRIRRAASS